MRLGSSTAIRNGHKMSKPTARSCETSTTVFWIASFRSRCLAKASITRKLSVAAIFRPFRTLAPYIQFVGRILRVIVQNDPNHPDNYGHIVTHVGMNLDELLKKFQMFENDDQRFWEEVTGGVEPDLPKEVLEGSTRMKLHEDMVVSSEIVEQLFEEDFLTADGHGNTSGPRKEAGGSRPRPSTSRTSRPEEQVRCHGPSSGSGSPTVQQTPCETVAGSKNTTRRRGPSNIEDSLESSWIASRRCRDPTNTAPRYRRYEQLDRRIDHGECRGWVYRRR